jgi:antitoxin CptB
MSAPADPVRWRCRRGMKELDVLLERFLERAFTRASTEQKRAFASLLELPDPLLAAYLFGHAIPEEPDQAALAKLIAACRD